MASPSPEPAIMEQVITEFFAKSLHIILSSRSPFVSSRNHAAAASFSPSPSSSPNSRPRDRWFNLALRDCPAALENFDLWRQSNLDPLVLDILLLRRNDSTVVERWLVQYEARTGINVSTSNSSELYAMTYKNIIVLLRSLYATVRLLPAYKLFRSLNSSGQILPVSLSHRISTFAEPFTRTEDAEMKRFMFTPVETPCGRLSLSVTYLPTLEDVGSEPSTPLSPQFISDYVGSPAADPLKRVQSMPVALGNAAFARRHSWSIDRGGTTSVSPSPPPTHSDSRAFRLNMNPCAADEMDPRASFGECWPSPPFSPSSSPSPPPYIRSGHLPNAIFRSESAPLSVSSPRRGKSSGLVNQGLPPSPSRNVVKKGCSSKADALKPHVTAASASLTSSPESTLRITMESQRFFELQSGIPMQKLLSFGRDDVANLSGLCSSQRIGFSRSSSSRLSLLDEMDDTVYPFAIDDEDLANSSYRTGHSDVQGYESGPSESGGFLLTRRSPDAEVGALVRMLKTAPPLRQDLSNSFRNSQSSRDEILNERVQYDKDILDGAQKNDIAGSSLEVSASVLLKSITTAEALVELRHYKEMKESLLSQAGLQSLDTERTEQSADGVSGEL